MSTIKTRQCDNQLIGYILITGLSWSMKAKKEQLKDLDRIELFESKGQWQLDDWLIFRFGVIRIVSLTVELQLLTTSISS